MPQQACIFCGRAKPLVSITKEHLFSRWVDDVLTPELLGPDRTFERTMASPSGGSQTKTWPTEVVAAIEAPVVCRGCNGGWMSGPRRAGQAPAPTHDARPAPHAVAPRAVDYRHLGCHEVHGPGVRLGELSKSLSCHKRPGRSYSASSIRPGTCRSGSQPWSRRDDQRSSTAACTSSSQSMPRARRYRNSPPARPSCSGASSSRPSGPRRPRQLQLPRQPPTGAPTSW
jgi:hypothetical protein